MSTVMTMKNRTDNIELTESEKGSEHIEDEEYAGVFRINTRQEGNEKREWVGRLVGCGKGCSSLVHSFIFGVCLSAAVSEKRRGKSGKREMKKRREIFPFPSHFSAFSISSHHHRRRHQRRCYSACLPSILPAWKRFHPFFPSLIPFLDYFFFFLALAVVHRWRKARHILHSEVSTQNSEQNSSSISFKRWDEKEKGTSKDERKTEKKPTGGREKSWSESSGEKGKSRLTSTKIRRNCYEKARHGKKERRCVCSDEAKLKWNGWMRWEWMVNGAKGNGSEMKLKWKRMRRI